MTMHKSAISLFILLCTPSYFFSTNISGPVQQEKIEFPLKKSCLEKRYKKREANAKVKLFFIVHNLGINTLTTTKILEILPKEVAVSFSPYVKPSESIVKNILKSKRPVFWVQPMELYRQQKAISDPYRLSRYKDNTHNINSVKNCLFDMPNFVTGIIAEETSPVLRDKETLSILLAELKKRNLPLLSPEMSVNNEFMNLCETNGITCDEADYCISRTNTMSDVVLLLKRVQELGEQTGYVICVIDAHMPYITMFLDWHKKLNKEQFELSPYNLKK
jgi:polysaccharide deacetylase 2 family uncharacterized protein YibQ